MRGLCDWDVYSHRMAPPGEYPNKEPKKTRQQLKKERRLQKRRAELDRVKQYEFSDEPPSDDARRLHNGGTGKGGQGAAKHQTGRPR